MATLGLVMLGGALGAASRWLLSQAIVNSINSSLPLATLSVNIVGSAIIGIVWSLSEKSILPPQIAALIIIGFLGSFTTFSAFSMETINLFRSGHIGTAILNVIMQNALCISAAGIGFYSGKFLLK
ncbi:MAG: fluoride efflux transporter CrcB [Chloroflexota bacterium]|nr:fluoride efflux transporter CrcB [Chloroflexota bacterium]|tara:strand:- start:4629 stop:5006 length:378 start_codon:yes stop_codon:yes gene_type:complete